MQRIIDIKDGVTRMSEWRMAQPVNFELLDGENIAIAGPNGGGKSMFVDIITGKHPLLGDCIKYDFTPSTKEYISDNIKYVCFKDTYGGDNDSTYYLQQRWNQTEIDPETATVGSRLEAAYQAAGDDTEERRQLIEEMPYKEEEYDAQRVVDMHKVSIRYGERTILKDLDWQVMNGEYWALTGRNGSGKSTLLSLVCADNPQSYACDITLFDKTRGSGESIWDIKKHIGYVSPEMHRAFRSNVTVERIVASGFSNAVSLYVKPDPQNHGTCLKWMSIFGIEQLADKSFLKLSSGEQRLVLLARAMVKDPELLILDEPLHGLDEPNRRHVKQVIEAFCQRKGKTLIMVTHYEDELPACINRKKILYRNK